MTAEEKNELIKEIALAYFDGAYDANCAIMALDAIITVADFEEDEKDA